MTQEEKMLAMLSRIDERTTSMKEGMKALGEQHVDLAKKLSETTAELHRKLEEGYPTKEVLDEKLTSYGRWLRFLSWFQMIVIGAVTGAWFKQ